MTDNRPKIFANRLKKALKLLAQALENLPPQEGYPELPSESWSEPPTPEPIGYVYHVSPYAKEIMEQGFILDPTKTTLGAFGELNSVSTTNYENAIVYKEGIQLVVGVCNGEIDTRKLVYMIGPSTIEEPVTYKMREEFSDSKVPTSVFPEEYQTHVERYKQEMAEFDKFVEEIQARGEPTDEELEKATEIYESIIRPISSFLDSKEGKEWLWNTFINDLDFEGNTLSEDSARQRRWSILKAAAFYTDIPVVCGYDIPEHLQTRKMSDVSIVEVAVAPVEYTKHPPYKEEDIGKGVYSYTPGEQEWKFYDITDLMPVRIVGMNHLKKAIKKVSTCPLREKSYGGIGTGGGYGSFMEYEIGAQRIAEAVHCILGSLGKWGSDWTAAVEREEAHIKEELNIVLKSMKEYSRSLYSDRMNTPIHPGYVENIQKSIENIKENSPILKGAAEKGLSEVLTQEDIQKNILNVAQNCYYVLIALAEALLESVSNDVVTNAFSDPTLNETVNNLKASIDTLYANTSLKQAIKLLALKINKDDLQTLWYENADGDKHVPDLTGNMPPDMPEGFSYQVSQFPNYLRTTYLKMVDPDEVAACPHPEEDIRKDYGLIDGLEGRECSLCSGQQTKNVGEEWPEEWEAYGSREMMAFESGWSEDLVLAMASSGDFTLSEAVIIASNSCERCMNVLLHDYGCDDGYPEFSDDWKKCGTECDFCRDLGNTKNGPDFLKEENE